MLLLFASVLGCVRISDADLTERMSWGLTDDTGAPCTTAWWFPDLDGDGYGDPAGGLELCEGLSGYVTNDADCDDTDAGISPQTIWFYDGDGDGYGDSATTFVTCEQPEGYTADQTDCDDLSAESFPGGTEVCDGKDNDCNGTVDDSAVDVATWYADADGDGYGSPDSSTTACEAPSGYTQDSTDCDDTTAAVSPEAEEICSDGLDNNCDGTPNDCSLSGEIVLSKADGVLLGESRFDYAGLSIDAHGDLTGDGAPDLVISAPYADEGGSGRGSVYLLSGPVSGERSLSEADVRIDGEEDLGRLGSSVASSDDITGDGTADLLIGASVVDSGAENAGRVYLMAGPLSGVISAAAASGTVDGGSVEDRLGTSVAAPGDVNGDELADLLIGAYGEDTGGSGAGAAFLVLGPATGSIDADSADASFWGEASEDWAGLMVSGAGDVDGDGLADLLIGADRNGASNAGAAYVVLGGVSGSMSLTDADWILRGLADYDEAGAGLGAAGDVNGDGLADVLIGGASADGAGVAWLVSGSGLASASLTDAIARIDGSSASPDHLGVDLTGAGDVNGDGLADVLIGGPGSGGSGAAWLFYGPISGALSPVDAGLTLQGATSGAEAGYRVAAPGDLSGDGVPDLLVASPSSSLYDSKAGAIFFIGGVGL